VDLTATWHGMTRDRRSLAALASLIALSGCVTGEPLFLTGEPLFDCAANDQLPMRVFSDTVGPSFVEIDGELVFRFQTLSGWLAECEATQGPPPGVSDEPILDGINTYILRVNQETETHSGPVRLESQSWGEVNRGVGLGVDGSRLLVYNADTSQLSWFSSSNDYIEGVQLATPPAFEGPSRVLTSADGPVVEFEPWDPFSLWSASAQTGWTAEIESSAEVGVDGGTVDESTFAVGTWWALDLSMGDELTVRSRAGESSQLAMDRPPGVDEAVVPSMCLEGTESSLHLVVFWREAQISQSTFSDGPPAALVWSDWESATTAGCLRGSLSHRGWGHPVGALSDGTIWSVSLAEETAESLSLRIDLSTGESSTWTHNGDGELRPVGKVPRDLGFHVTRDGTFWALDGQNARLYRVPLR